VCVIGWSAQICSGNYYAARRYQGLSIHKTDGLFVSSH